MSMLPLVFNPLLVVLLALLYPIVIERRALPLALLPAGLLTREGVAAGAGLLLAVLSAAFLPWPVSTAAGERAAALLWLALLLEAAAISPLVPALLDSQRLLNRAAMRELQIGVAGRVVLWVVAAIAIWAQPASALVQNLVTVWLAIGYLLALPVASTTGPFSASDSLLPGGVEDRLTPAAAVVLRLARAARGAVLLLGLPLLCLPVYRLDWRWGLAAIVAAIIGAGLLLERLVQGLPRQSLQGALHWSWLRALPFAIIALVTLVLLG